MGRTEVFNHRSSCKAGLKLNSLHGLHMLSPLYLNLCWVWRLSAADKTLQPNREKLSCWFCLVLELVKFRKKDLV